MGMIMLTVLLLLMLACVAVKPRTKAVLYGSTSVLGVLVVVLHAALLLGYMPWGWDTRAIR
jgi:hypothetical protein